jgi:SecD/SecF fusion protein
MTSDMNRFLLRIIVCAVPTLLSIGVVAWAYHQYENGRGGFRLGVDLVGGTILVYEVDESKMPDNFKAEDLAAALKRRIDPADLYNITIRPVPGTQPRVEIILPTGGKHQAAAERKNWEKVLEKAYADFPGKAKENPYLDIKMSGREAGGPPALADAIAKLNPDVPRQEISDWIEKNTEAGSKDKRLLTSEEVENIKNLIEKQGRLEFRILANTTDDEEGIAAAREYFKSPKAKEELKRLEVRAEPPPQPRREDGSLFFPVRLADEPQHSYSWVELGKSQLYSLHLNSDALKRNKMRVYDRGGREIANVAAALESGQPFQMYSDLYYVRRITDWTRRLAKDRDLGKELEFFVLVRDPIKGQEITGDYLVNASESRNAKGERTIAFRFNAEGGNLFYDVTTKNKPTGSKETGFLRQLAIIFDSQVVSAPTLNEPIRTNGEISGRFTQQEIDDMVRILRAGALPATLKKEPVSQNSMGATLGADTITKGTWSVGVAFIVVMAFMVFYYRFAGLVACMALMANLLMTVAFMVLVQAAFTLPGLAGLVLMLGMAVDANVLIYERLREERDRGANLAMALRNGYDRAFPTIVDTHLSSIFTAIVLYVVGNDQLKGFGISLTVGLIISLFTSLYMTRTIFEIWLYKGWLKNLSFFNGLVRLIHARYWDFMSIRYYWFTGTVVLTVLGAALFIYRLDSNPETGKTSVLNIDFIGGTAYTAQLAEPMTLDDLRKRLEPEHIPQEKRLPDLAIEQIFVGTDTDSSGDASRYFTVRTSERKAQAVFEYVQDNLGDRLKRINVGKIDILKPGREAKLTFVSQDGKPDFASPAQVQMLVANEFEKHDLPRAGFTIERPSDKDKEKEEHYSELTVKVNEPLSPNPSRAATLFATILNDVKADFARAPQPERLENFDRQLASNTRERAMYAILASWAAILLYLWFRFGSWTFGAATVLCLIHDLFFTLGVIAAARFVHGTWIGNLLAIQDFKIDLQSVAALLTLVGYSVNDTIVVFDRIREVRGKNPLLTPQMINDSVNQTLTRTILASMTVWLVVIVLYIWGGEGVHLFAFVMVVGVIVGTYSSIYIASPLLLIFGEGRATRAQLDRAAQVAAAQR